jgi:hypothetical protein
LSVDAAGLYIGNEAHVVAPADATGGNGTILLFGGWGLESVSLTLGSPADAELRILFTSPTNVPKGILLYGGFLTLAAGNAIEAYEYNADGKLTKKSTLAGTVGTVNITVPNILSSQLVLKRVTTTEAFH